MNAFANPSDTLRRLVSKDTMSPWNYHLNNCRAFPNMHNVDWYMKRYKMQCWILMVSCQRALPAMLAIGPFCQDILDISVLFLAAPMYRYWWEVTPYLEGILPKGPYLPCVSMAGRALLAGYHRSMYAVPPSTLFGHGHESCLLDTVYSNESI